MLAADDVAVSTIYQANLGTYSDSRGKNLQVDESTVYLTQIKNVTNEGAVHRIPTSGGAELASILPVHAAGPRPRRHDIFDPVGRAERKRLLRRLRRG